MAIFPKAIETYLLCLIKTPSKHQKSCKGQHHLTDTLVENRNNKQQVDYERTRHIRHHWETGLHLIKPTIKLLGLLLSNSKEIRSPSVKSYAKSWRLGSVSIRIVVHASASMHRSHTPRFCDRYIISLCVGHHQRLPQQRSCEQR